LTKGFDVDRSVSTGRGGAAGAERKAICGICPAGCRVLVTLDREGRLDKVRADDGSPLGMVCKLGERSREIVYSPDRIAYPMRRVGAKGTVDASAFERISWDTAMAEIARRHVEIKKDYGAEATAIYTGRGSFELSMCDLYQPKGVAVSSASIQTRSGFSSPSMSRAAIHTTLESPITC